MSEQCEYLSAEHLHIQVINDVGSAIVCLGQVLDLERVASFVLTGLLDWIDRFEIACLWSIRIIIIHDLQFLYVVLDFR